MDIILSLRCRIKAARSIVQNQIYNYQTLDLIKGSNCSYLQYACMPAIVKSTVRLHLVFQGDSTMENVPLCCGVSTVTDVPDVPNGIRTCIFNNVSLINKLVCRDMSGDVFMRCRNVGYNT